MYKGTRDDHISIRVPQAHCDKYNAINGKFIEIKLPGMTPTEWDSFMVDPGQVFFDHIMPDMFNIIEGLNRNTKVLVNHKVLDDKGRRSVVAGTDVYYDPTEIITLFRACN